jgi:predicted ATPase
MPGEPPGSRDPLDPAGLVGRAAEAAAIRRMLDGAPLVTVTGLPGVGKTAVSLAAARAAAAGFADGSLLLRLDRLRDEALLPHTIEAALRLADAVELFGRRAAQAGTQITSQNRAAVASICVQLDKLPLAIELAAAELARLGRDRPSRPPAAALAERLTRLEAGQAGPDGTRAEDASSAELGRHRTLRAAIGWSHELCTPSERLLWARLSVFSGPFGLRDTTDVCGGDELPAEAVAAVPP